jgi:Ricin-type beta-trefoil lectin domain
MLIRRLVTLLFTAAMAITAGLAIASPAQAANPIIKLVSLQNGKCLQPINGSLDRGDAIVQQTCNGSMAQQWFEVGISSTAVHLQNRQSNLCLDARGGAVNGTPIQQWPCNSISNEKWGYGITNNLLGSFVAGTASHCIATPGSQDGLPMELRFCDGNSSQLWSRPAG